MTARHVEAAVAELDEEEEAPVVVTPEAAPEIVDAVDRGEVTGGISVVFDNAI